MYTYKDNSIHNYTRVHVFNLKKNLKTYGKNCDLYFENKFPY